MKYKFRIKHSPKELRQLSVDNIQKELKQAKSFLLFSSKGITHQEFESLRQKLADSQATLRFIKNTLFRVAAKELKLPVELYTDKVLFGPSAIIYIQTNDYLSTIKILSQQFGINEKVKVKIALLDQEIYDSTQILEFAEIPSEQELKAKLVGTLEQPISSLYHVLSYDLKRLSITLKEIANR